MATYKDIGIDPTRNRTVPGPDFETRGEGSEKAQKAKEAAGQKGREMKDKAAGMAQSKLEEGKEMGERNLESTAHALRDAADTLKEDEHDSLARGTEWTAERIDMAVQYFRERNVEEVIRDMRHLARENPMMVLGGALMAGFLTARFLGSSGRGGYETSAPREWRHGGREETAYRPGYTSPGHASPSSVPPRHFG